MRIQLTAALNRSIPGAPHHRDTVKEAERATGVLMSHWNNVPPPNVHHQCGLGEVAPPHQLVACQTTNMCILDCAVAEHLIYSVQLRRDSFRVSQAARKLHKLVVEDSEITCSEMTPQILHLFRWVGGTFDNTNVENFFLGGGRSLPLCWLENIT